MFCAGGTEIYLVNFGANLLLAGPAFSLDMLLGIERYYERIEIQGFPFRDVSTVVADQT